MMNRTGQRTSAYADPAAVGRRIFRGMCIVVAGSVLLSAPFAPWRVTTGLLIGGLLSLLNHHWLRTSVAAVFGKDLAAGVRPKLGVARYLLRYFVIGAGIAVAHTLNIASLVAMLVGMCSFVVPALMEGFVQTYFVIMHRGELK